MNNQTKKNYGQRKSSALHQHWTWKQGIMKAKRQFKTLDEALCYMDNHKIDNNKYHPYVCPDCGMWHIGHSKKHKK